MIFFGILWTCSTTRIHPDMHSVTLFARYLNMFNIITTEKNVRSKGVYDGSINVVSSLTNGAGEG